MDQVCGVMQWFFCLTCDCTMHFNSHIVIHLGSSDVAYDNRMIEL